MQIDNRLMHSYFKRSEDWVFDFQSVKRPIIESEIDAMSK